jgi:hypothetical protein
MSREPHGPQTIPNLNFPKINSLLTTAKRRLAEHFLQVRHARQAPILRSFGVVWRQCRFD